MNSFEWSLPTNIHFGIGKFAKSYKLLKGMGGRALVVTSKSFMPGGARHEMLKGFLAQLKEIRVDAEVFGDIEPNPRTETIDRAAELIRAKPVQFVVALGGGSVMDAGKCIAMLALNEGKCWDYAIKGSGRDRKMFNHALPLVCIPTVAATSSETDSYAVVTDWKTRRKMAVAGDALQPTLAIIDPTLTYTVGPVQTVDGAFDIITHVMETYLSTDSPTPFQDRLTESVVETVCEFLPLALENPRNAEARSNLSWCSSFALCGVFAGRDGSFPVHGLEHGLSAYTDVAHGRGLAMLLPRKMAFDAAVIGEKIVHFNRKIFGVEKTADPILALNKGLVTYMKKVNAWTMLKDLPPADDLIKHTVTHALEVDGTHETGKAAYLDNIRPIYFADAEKILRACEKDDLTEI